MPTLAKICGLSTPETVEAAVEGGAAYLGFVLFPRSPRAVTTERAQELITQVGDRARTVLLLVDPDDALLDTAGALEADLLQLHGRETPERVAAVKARTGLPVIKALPVATKADLERAADYADVADHLMFDAKPPSGADRPGGHGTAFDWGLLSDQRRDDWFLAGGLTPANVGEAIRVTGAPIVDVSSGVETAPGLKDTALIAAFLAAVREA